MTRAGMTASELDFELRCRAEYKRQTGREIDPQNYDEAVVTKVIQAVRQEMFNEKVTENKR